MKESNAGGFDSPAGVGLFGLPAGAGGSVADGRTMPPKLPRRVCSGRHVLGCARSSAKPRHCLLP